MPPFRYFRESAASGRGRNGSGLYRGELIYANVRLRLAANRTYGLVAFVMCFTAKFRTARILPDKAGLVINQSAIAGDTL